eukprot:3141821-Amphidinium_carterae.2
MRHTVPAACATTGKSSRRCVRMEQQGDHLQTQSLMQNAAGKDDELHAIKKGCRDGHWSYWCPLRHRSNLSPHYNTVLQYRVHSRTRTVPWSEFSEEKRAQKKSYTKEFPRNGIPN